MKAQRKKDNACTQPQFLVLSFYESKGESNQPFYVQNFISNKNREVEPSIKDGETPRISSPVGSIHKAWGNIGRDTTRLARQMSGATSRQANAN